MVSNTTKILHFYLESTRWMFFVSFFNVFHGRNELFLAFIVVFHGRKEVIVKKSFFFHGRRTFFLHFLSSSMEDGRSFLFSANPMLQRRSFSYFFSMGLISNAHRVEAARTSSSWKAQVWWEDQGKHWTLQHQGWNFTSIIRNVTLDGGGLTYRNQQTPVL